MITLIISYQKALIKGGRTATACTQSVVLMALLANVRVRVWVFAFCFTGLGNDGGGGDVAKYLRYGVVRYSKHVRLRVCCCCCVYTLLLASWGADNAPVPVCRSSSRAAAPVCGCGGSIVDQFMDDSEHYFTSLSCFIIHTSGSLLPLDRRSVP